MPLLSSGGRAAVAPVVLLFAAQLCSVVSPAQLPPRPQQTAQTVRPAPPKLLARFDVGKGTVQDLSISAGNTGEYDIALALGDAFFTMVVHEHDVRGPGFSLFVRDATGLHQVPTPPCVTFRGALLEETGSRVIASIIDGGLTAEIHRPSTSPGIPGETWVVQPVRTVEPSAGPRVHLVYRARDNDPLPFQCGITAMPPPPPPTPPTGVDLTVQCEIALEGDVQFYQQNGSSVTATQNDITAVMNSVDFIFDRDCDVQYIVTTIIVSTTSIYSTNDPGSLLSEFGNEWTFEPRPMQCLGRKVMSR